MIDGFTFLARSLFLVFIIVRPSSTPKRSFMNSSILNSLMFLVIPASPYLGSWGFPLLVIAMIISGFCRSFNIMPMLVLSDEFDAAGKDSFKVKLWQSIVVYGEIISFVVCGLIMNALKWDWKICVYVNVGGFFLVSLWLYLAADEIDMSKKNAREDGSEPSFF